MLDTLKASVERQWYGVPHWLFLFWPLQLVFIALAALRRKRQQQAARKPPVPVLVVGNITVGGTGKTPVLIALCQYLKQCGYKPGVISRGYGAKVDKPTLVGNLASAAEVGDEPVLIAELTSVPVMVGADRVACAFALVDSGGCNVILCDDGLQHYRLGRDIEWAIFDGGRGVGNGWRLPIGPLREPIARLRQVDEVLVNGPARPSFKATAHFQLQPLYWHNVATGEQRQLNTFDLQGAVAVAGIGNPERFFSTLKSLGFSGRTKAFADHHPFSPQDFAEFGDATVLMTSKDAVKCRTFAGARWWALVVAAELPAELLARLEQQLQQA